jgi:hypothetical protein
MKARLTILLVFVVFSGFAQPGFNNRNCRSAMPDNLFRQRHKAITAARSESQKFEMAKILALDECLSTLQVKSVADILRNDFDKLEFAKMSYQNTVDKENFYNVFDSFTHMSTAFLLYDYLQEKNSLSYPIDYLPPSHGDNNYNNPIHDNEYHGGNFNNNDQGMNGPCHITQREFENMLQTIRNESFDDTKITIIKNILKLNPCIRTQQLKEVIALLSFDANKLEIAKYAYEYTLDRENYYSIADSLTFSSSKEDLMKFIQSRH